MITLVVAGIEYGYFKSASATITLDSLSGSFSFDAIGDENDDYSSPFEVGDSCIVKVDGEAVITGFIEKETINYDDGSHTITYEGRDVTCDVIDSTIFNASEFAGNIDISDLIKRFLSNNGITGIKVINTVSGLNRFSKADIIAPELGSECFEWLKKIASKRQVFLITDGNGNILISRSSGQAIPDKLINTNDSSLSNIKSASRSIDNTQRFSKYIVISQGNVAGDSGTSDIFGGSSSKSRVVHRRVVTSDNQIRNTRAFAIVESTAYTDSDLKQKGLWEQNIRATEGDTYTCTVQGFSRQSGRIWRPNLLVNIEDSFCGIDDQLLTKSVTFNYSTDSGSITELTLIDKNSFLTEFIEPKKIKKAKKKSKKSGGILF